VCALTHAPYSMHATYRRDGHLVGYVWTTFRRLPDPVDRPGPKGKRGACDDDPTP